jgi:hypothetical protein
LGRSSGRSSDSRGTRPDGRYGTITWFPDEVLGTS